LSGSLKIAVAGLGTVGVGVLRLLAEDGGELARRCGHTIEVTAVSARERGRERNVKLDSAEWFDDAATMAREADAEVVVELIGGDGGVAREVCEAAIGAGRHVVTANKALIALHGTTLARRAEEAGLALCYEAAVAGGIPIIKAMREGLAANTITSLYGILNGTCNYILSTMRESGREFDDVLVEAQRLGYAESDPRFDVDGIDTAHKLTILTSVAFGHEVDFDGVYIEGIRHVSAQDIVFADELGYRIKLLAIARSTKHGIEQRVHPCLVVLDSPIAHVEGVFNATSAVVADLMDIARGVRVPTFAVPAHQLKSPQTLPMDRHRGAYYIRLMVVDRPGVFADIAGALRDEEVSMEGILQRARAPGEAVPVVMTTHDTEEAAMNRVLARFAKFDTVIEPPRMIRIEPLAK